VWYSKLEKTFISRYILHQHWYTCPIALPVRRNPQHRNLLTAVSVTSASGRAWSATFKRPWQNFSTQLWTALRNKHFHGKQETFLYVYPLHCVLLPTEKAQQNSALRWYTPKARSPFWLLKPASEHAHARLLPTLSWRWTVLVPSDTVNLLRPLQLLNFHLWPIYWLFLIQLLSFWMLTKNSIPILIHHRHKFSDLVYKVILIKWGRTAARQCSCTLLRRIITYGAVKHVYTRALLCYLN
jgi:hypothetical protein